MSRAPKRERIGRNRTHPCAWSASMRQEERSEARDGETRRNMRTGLTAFQDIRSPPPLSFARRPWSLKSVAENKAEEPETRVRKGQRQDLYRPPRLLLAGGPRRMGTVAVWRRLHAPPDRDMAASEPESQDSVVGTRDADGRALLDSPRRVLQASLSAVCRYALV